MVKKEHAKGFGARYGPKVRQKYSDISKKQKGPFKCPYCTYEQVKRKAVGIWHCRKCDSTFTNKAYEVGEVAPIKTQIEENFGVEEGAEEAEVAEE